MRKLKIDRCLIFLILTIALCLAMVSPAFAESGQDAGAGSDLPSATGTDAETASGSVFEVSSSLDNGDFNLVLLIDRSGSMKNTDRSKFVQDAAKMIVDLCDEGGQSRIAVMSFDTSVNNSGFISVSDSEQRELIKNEISAINYESGGTDIGLAMLSAVDYIGSEKKDGQRNLILLFTDGYTQDLVGKTVQDSEAQLQQALEKAVEYDCRIFTIGTNYNGSMKENGRIALEGIRDYQIANGVSNAPEELLNIIDAKDQDSMKVVVSEFEKIYATIGKRIIHEGNVIIRSPNIAEANIIISAPDGISEAVLTAPSGSSAVIDLGGKETTLDNARIVYKAGQAYQLIKIIEPIATGTWVLNVADNQSEPILNYTWMLTSKAEITMALRQQSKHKVVIMVRPKNVDQSNLMDFFSSLTEKSVVVTKKGEEGNPTPLDLHYDPEMFSLTASFSVDPSATYTVTTKVSDGYFVRTCTDSIAIPAIWSGPADELPVGTIYMWNWFSKTVDLSDMLGQYLQGCESVDGGDGLAEFEIDGTIIKVRSLSAGSKEIRIKGVLEDGSEVELTGKLKVLNPLIPILAVVLLIAVIVFVVVRKKRRRSLRGNYFLNFIVTLEEGQHKVPEVQIPPHRAFTMYELIQSYRRSVQKKEWAAIMDREVLNEKSQLCKALKNSKFQVCADEQSFIFEDNTYRRHQTRVEWHSDDNALKVSFLY